MARALTMPKLSDSMEEATILRWLKGPGEPFSRGEPLAEIETDKATVVYEAESDGVIGSIVVPEGGTARLGEEIATLDGGEGASPERREPRADPPHTARPEPVPATARQDEPARAQATPVARRRAVELGLSLVGISGTGPGGRITATDVERAAADGQATTNEHDRGAVETITLGPTQATIAKRMALAASTIPTFTVSMEIDVSSLVALRRGAGGQAARPSVNDFLVRAAALTLRELPAFNSSFVDERIERYSRINVGIAVAVEDALLVPTVFDADTKSLSQIAGETRSLIERAKRRALTPDELAHGTFTLSNLGMYGVHSFTAIVNPPQCAILAVGGISRRPLESDRGTELHKTMLATLSADHRIVYGADGAAFLAHLKSLLEQPEALIG